MDTNKGIHVLIDAMRYIIPEGLPIHLLLIGNLNTPALRRQIERNPREEHIHLAGYRMDAPALQAACNAVVLPTIWREGDGRQSEGRIHRCFHIYATIEQTLHLYKNSLNRPSGERLWESGTV